MTRRRFQTLTNASQPTMENMVRRDQSRRTFRELQGGYRKPPPSPWVGKIIRFTNPLVVSDYETLATDTWLSDSFYDAWRAAATPVFGGDLWDCKYFVLDPPVSSSVGAETSVILPPIRLTVSEPAVDGDPFTVWEESPFANSYRSNSPYWQIFAQDTFLPVSGDSHVSNTNPSVLAFNLGLFYLPDAVNQLLTWPGTAAITNYPLPTNFMIAARYVRIRKNGSVTGSLIDRETYLDDINTQNGAFPNRLQGEVQQSIFSSPGETIRIGFPSNPGTLLPVAYNEGWTLSFTAGDTIEVDVWLEARIRNWNVTETNPLLILVPEINQTYSQRIGRIHTASPQWTVRDYTQVSRQSIVALNGLEMSVGFDPSIHTYQFTPTGGTIVLGKAESPALIFTVTSKELVWRYDITTPASGAVTYTTFISTSGGVKTTRWEFVTVSVGAVVTLSFGSGSDLFSYTSTTTNTSTFAADVKTAIDAFVAARPGDPHWGAVTADIPPANPWVVRVNYGTSQTLTVTGTSGSPATSNFVDVRLTYGDEMVLLAVADTNLNRTAFYRPQSSGDYVEEVDDEFEGTLLSGPTGVFDHMGTTVFELWNGAQDSPYDGRGTLPAGFPSSISVQKVNQ